jgi:hypothetical protein
LKHQGGSNEFKYPLLPFGLVLFAIVHLHIWKKMIMQIEPELVKLFASRFVNRLSAYSVQWDNGSGYTALYKPVTERLINQHLQGELTLSLPALDVNNTGKWLCFDSDTANGALDQLEQFLTGHNWRCIRESKREGKDGHLWLLLDSQISGEHLVNLSNAIIKLSKVSTDKLEAFPKQKRIEKLGSGVRLPINYHRKIQRRTWFEIPPKDIKSQLYWLAEQPLNDASAAIELAKVHKSIVLPQIRQVRKYRGSHFVNILDFIQARRSGKELVAQCPLCAAEGHDRHRDNLRISQDGQKFCCWYGGAAAIHRTGDIVRALGQRKRLV